MKDIKISDEEMKDMKEKVIYLEESSLLNKDVDNKIESE